MEIPQEFIQKIDGLLYNCYTKSEHLQFITGLEAKEKELKKRIADIEDRLSKLETKPTESEKKKATK